MATVNQSPSNATKIKAGLKEISDSMTRIEGEKDFIKEAIKNLAGQSQIEKKTIAKMAKVYHKQNFPEMVAEADEFEATYQNVVR